MTREPGVGQRATRDRGWPGVVIVVAVAVFAAALYANSVVNEFVFDDRLLIEKNSALTKHGSIASAWVSPYHSGLEAGASGLYRPLVVATFAVNYVWGGLHPIGYHLVNVALHAVVSVLVLLLAWRLGAGKKAALVAAVLFAAHPIHTEAVANLAGRAELMAALFFLLALIAHMEAGALDGPRRHRLMVAASAAFFLALCSKENAITLIGAAVAYDALFVRRREGDAPASTGTVLAIAVRKQVYLFPALLAYLGLRWVALGGALGGPSGIPFVDNPVAGGSLVIRWMTATVVTVRYLALLVFPVDLSPDYSYAQIPPVESPLNPGFVLSVAVLILLSVAAVWAARKSAVTAFSILFAVVTFSIVSNFVVPIGTIMAERLLYLPSVGFSLLVGVGVGAAGRRLGRPLWVAVALIVVLAGSKTVARNTDWRDALTLFSRASVTSPESAKVRNNLGTTLMRRGRTEEARREFVTALEIYPDYLTARLNLGQTLLLAGEGDQAERQSRQILATSPGNVRALAQLGAALLQQGRLDEAETHLREVIELEPTDAVAHGRLGSLHLARGETASAEGEFREAIRLDPGSSTAHNDLGLLYQHTGRPAEAVPHLVEAVRLSPDSAPLRNNLANVYRETGRVDAAIEELEVARSLDPALSATHYNLGLALEQGGRDEVAVVSYAESVRLDPGHAEAHRALGRIALREGDATGAMLSLDQAVRIVPGDPESRALRARAAMALGRDDAAESDYLALVEINPASVEAHTNLGVIHARRGELDEARRWWEAALRLAPNSVQIRRNLQALGGAGR